MTEEQTKLIQEEGEAPGKKKTSATGKRATNSRELYAKIEDITLGTQKAVEQNGLETKKSLEEISLNTQSTVEEISLNTQRTVEDIMASTGSMGSIITDVRDELSKLVSEFLIMSGRLDEIQGPIVVEELDSPAPAAQPQSAGEISRDALDSFKKQIAARDAELSNKKFSNLMERMCLMREDYGALCRNMHKDIAKFSAADVLKSFEAYLVDMENMLYDAGIAIGPYGKDGDQVDVAHQRIVGVVSTTDPSKNGTVAARLSDGYEYNGRALVKEKVNVYKVAEPAPDKSEDEVVEILG